MFDDTIYAVSSGRPPAAIAVMRISGTRAHAALVTLAGAAPPPRIATLRTLRSASGGLLDRALILWFPGPASATGEDIAELHLHGGIAVVAAVSRALADIGLRRAEPGEFTRRAVLSGRLDLNEAEGLADLLAAETETQRREATLRATGALGRELAGWTRRLLEMTADIEGAIDYDEEADFRIDIGPSIDRLRAEIAAALARPTADRLRDGIRVAIVGPVNAGKSSLFNALVGSEAAIVTPLPGTTRDAIERPVVMDGVAFVLIDTAGMRQTDDVVESIGIERARIAAASADIVIDLSEDAVAGAHRIIIAAKADLASGAASGLPISLKTGDGLAELRAMLVAMAGVMLPADGEVTLNDRYRAGLVATAEALGSAVGEQDPLLVAEHLIAARHALDLLTGNAGIEDVLDTLFSRFCLGK